MVHSRNVSQEAGSSAQDELLDALSALHIGGKYSDLTIVCNSRQWAVHKAIICSRSGFFDSACSHPFQEASSGIVDLSEDDEDAVDQMIHYLYHLDYLNEQPHQSPSAMFRHRAFSDTQRKHARKVDLSQIEDPLLAQIGFYAPQKRAGSPPKSPPSKGSRSSVDSATTTKAATATRSPSRRVRTPSTDLGTSRPDIRDDYTNSNDNNSYDEFDDADADEPSTEFESHLLLHTRVYAIAEKYDIPSLKQLARAKFEMAMACYYDSPEFADAIDEVYCSTLDSDRGLRDVVLQAFRMHPQLASTQDVFAVIKSTPSLALDLYKLERGIPV